MKNSSKRKRLPLFNASIAKAQPNRHLTYGMPKPDEIGLLGALAIFAGVACMVFFFLFPQIDYHVTQSVVCQSQRFCIGWHWSVSGFRRLLLASMLITYGFFIVCWIRTYRLQVEYRGLSWDKWAYLSICGLVGPLLLINIILKNVSSRPRPRELEEFGYDAKFEPFWHVGGDQCFLNCSFPSGEVATTVMLLFSVALVCTDRRLRKALLFCGLLAGLLIALLRIVMGGHYLSDTLMAIILMMVVATEVYYVFFLRDGGWIDRANEKRQRQLREEAATKNSTEK